MPKRNGNRKCTAFDFLAHRRQASEAAAVLLSVKQRQRRENPKPGCQPQGHGFREPLSFSTAELNKDPFSFPTFYLLLHITSQFRKPFALHSKSAALFTLCSSPRSKRPVEYINTSQQNLTPQRFLFCHDSPLNCNIHSMVSKARVSIIS